MAFHEVQFPTDLSRGSRGGPAFSTEVQSLDSGAEVRIGRWDQARHSFDASYAVKTYDELATVLEFFHARKGRLHGFRFKDWMDFTTAADHQSAHDWDDHSLGTFGTATDSIQLRKGYTSGATTEYRNITKPVTGTVKIGWDHDSDGTPTEQLSGWTVDDTTGVVTITDSSADGKTIYGGCEFDVPVRFGDLANELLDFSHDTFNIGSVSSIPLLEIKDPTVSADDFIYGGAKQITNNGSMSVAKGRVWWSAQAIGTYNLTLPQPTNYYALGGPYFYILHAGTGGTVGVYDWAGPLLKTLNAGEGCVVHLVITGGVREFRVWG